MVVIDAVLGIGGRPGIPDDLARLGEQLSAASWLAVDLPSGLDANSGTVTTSLRADVTVTFATRKWCHVAPPAAERCGRIDVVDILSQISGARVAGSEQQARDTVAPREAPRDGMFARSGADYEYSQERVTSL